MKYTFADARAADEKLIQYYEVMGNRGIYKEGWKAVVNHTFTEDYKDDVWELYHVAEDYSEKYNVADQYPEKLRELQEDFMHEAGKYGVFPMLRGAFHARPENLSRMYGDHLQLPEKTVEFHNIIEPFDLTRDRNIDTANAGHVVIAEIVRSSKKEEGVIYSNGQRFGGVTFYVKDNHLKYAYNDNVSHTIAESEHELSTGTLTVGFSFIRKKDHAIVTLYVNEQEEATVKIEHFAYMIGFSSTVGANRYTPVVPEYEVPFAWQGKLNALKLQQLPTIIDGKKEIEKFFSVE